MALVLEKISEISQYANTSKNLVSQNSLTGKKALLPRTNEHIEMFDKYTSYDIRLQYGEVGRASLPYKPIVPRGTTHFTFKPKYDKKSPEQWIFYRDIGPTPTLKQTNVARDLGLSTTGPNSKYPQSKVFEDYMHYRFQLFKLFAESKKQKFSEFSDAEKKKFNSIIDTKIKGVMPEGVEKKWNAYFKKTMDDPYVQTKDKNWLLNKYGFPFSKDYPGYMSEEWLYFYYEFRGKPRPPTPLIDKIFMTVGIVFAGAVITAMTFGAGAALFGTAVPAGVGITGLSAAAVPSAGQLIQKGVEKAADKAESYVESLPQTAVAAAANAAQKTLGNVLAGELAPKPAVKNETADAAKAKGAALDKSNSVAAGLGVAAIDFFVALLAFKKGKG